MNDLPIPSRQIPCSCISWNPSLSRLHAPMLAVGSDLTNTSGPSQVRKESLPCIPTLCPIKKWKFMEELIGQGLWVKNEIISEKFTPKYGSSYLMGSLSLLEALHWWGLDNLVLSIVLVYFICHNYLGQSFSLRILWERQKMAQSGNF